jgi:hypothetical protein
MKMKNIKMKKYICFSFVILFFYSYSAAQQSEAEKEKDRPVRAPFASGILLDNQTSVIPTQGTLEMLIQHRFNNMDNGLSDIWGIYSPGANIRIGFNYSVRNNLMVGYGLTMKNMYSDFQAKWNLLQQTRRNTIPVAVTLYGNMAIDGRNDLAFGEDYKFTNRVAYFSQLIVGRRFNDWLSLQATGSFTHYNIVAPDKDHDKIGVGFNGRARVSPQGAIIFQYDAPLKIKAITEQHAFIDPPKPNFAIGYEVTTSTHAFHIFISSANGIIPQDIYMHNRNDWRDGAEGLAFGFTITRLWSF